MSTLFSVQRKGAALHLVRCIGIGTRVTGFYSLLHFFVLLTHPLSRTQYCAILFDLLHRIHFIVSAGVGLACMHRKYCLLTVRFSSTDFGTTIQM